MVPAYFTPLEINPALTLLGMVTLASLLFLLLLLVLEAPRKLLTLAALATAVLHIAYMVAYAKVYNLELYIKPLLDVYVDKRGHASATIDMAQLILIVAVITQAKNIYTRLKKSI